MVGTAKTQQEDNVVKSTIVLWSVCGLSLGTPASSNRSKTDLVGLSQLVIFELAPGINEYEWLCVCIAL